MKKHISQAQNIVDLYAVSRYEALREAVEYSVDVIYRDPRSPRTCTTFVFEDGSTLVRKGKKTGIRSFAVGKSEAPRPQPRLEITDVEIFPDSRKSTAHIALDHLNALRMSEFSNMCLASGVKHAQSEGVRVVVFPDGSALTEVDCESKSFTAQQIRTFTA